MNPWALKNVDTTGDKYYSRNAYFWKVDTAGNQLPYVDELVRVVCESQQVINLKVIAGEFTHAAQMLELKNYTLYKEGEEQGGYRALLWELPYGGNAPQIIFHQEHKDPVKRKIFSDMRFRQAMSLGIDRQEISKLVYFGKGVPLQGGLDPTAGFYEDWMGKYYAEYDPDRANKLLDEIGLQWDSDHEFRLRPDGKQFVITLEYCQAPIPYGRILEILKDQWKKLGFNIVVKEDQRELLTTRGAAGELDAGIWHAYAAETQRFQTPLFVEYGTWVGNNEWYQWHTSGGTKGIEPPDYVKKDFEMCDKWQQTLPGTEQYMKLAKEIFTNRIKHLVGIGTTSPGPKPVIFTNRLRNVPDVGVWEWAYRQLQPYLMDQWYLKE